ncbi:hypothetical protein [Kitasatospora cinereorecta]|uniref:SMI1/KNR4 family protein n=1 Tax=Kitasatospora cinereorecta TaxID=285560 RepID=A0ABW0VE04_9ACTN
MEITAHLAAIEDLLVEPIPGPDRAGTWGRSGPTFHVICLRAFDRTGPDGIGEDAAAELSAVVADLWPQFGQPRTVAMGGFLDPSLRIQAGPSLTEFLTGAVAEMYGWSVGQRWLGVGLLRGAEDGPSRLVAAVSTPPRWDSREPSAVGSVELSPAAWVERLLSLTGWTGQARSAVDWTSVEKRLGRSLPGDYVLLAERFGAGCFDRSIDLWDPDGLTSKALELGALLESFPECREVYNPYPVHPAAKGLLQWGATSAEHEFYWLTADADPGKWPIIARFDSAAPWERFDCSASEFVCRMLTDRRHPYSLADCFEAHWFDSYERTDSDDDLR